MLEEKAMDIAGQLMLELGVMERLGEIGFWLLEMTLHCPGHTYTKNTKVKLAGEVANNLCLFELVQTTHSQALESQVSRKQMIPYSLCQRFAEVELVLYSSL